MSWAFLLVVDPTLTLRAELVIDGEKFEFLVSDGSVDLRYKAATDPQAVLSIDFEAGVAVADGRLSMEDFGANHVKVLAGEPVHVEEMMDLVSAAMQHMAS